MILDTNALSALGNDIWIAALARQHKMPVLSKDRHFDSVQGIQRIDW